MSLTISARDWDAYIKRLAALNEAAAEKMRKYVRENGFADMNALIDRAYALVTRYGEGSAALSAAMYDAVAEMSGKLFDPAVPAETADYSQVARTVQGVAKASQDPDAMGSAVGRMVKQAGADTTLQNALRDGAEFAWVPHGDTCAFCITLASRGWQRASQKAVKGGHAEHIHNNCDCTYAIRFDGKGGVAGYDPEKYRAMYDAAEGDTPQEKINALRRAQYAENREEINAQKRAAYAERKGLKSEGKPDNINVNDYIAAAKQAGDTVQPESIRRNYDDFQPLEITDEVREELRELNRLAKETDEEQGFSRYPGGKSDIHTDHDHNGVHIPIPKEGEHIELYHCHTDDSVLSPKDFQTVLDARIDRQCVISRNGDVWLVDFSHGIRPTAKELDDAVKMCDREAERTVMADPGNDGWSFEERYYMRGRERMYRLGRLFEWRVMGGHIDG